MSQLGLETPVIRHERGVVQVTRQRNTMAEVEAPQECCLQTQAAGMITSGCVGFEPYGTEIVPWSQPRVRIESGVGAW